MDLKRDGMNWEHDETVLALELYFRTPYGSIHAHNPEIIQLASLLQRKPGAVAYKMGNLASLDPELRASGRKGLSNGAKIDKLVFDEYYMNWNKLVLDAELIKNSLINRALQSIEADQSTSYRNVLGREIEGKTKVRVGQSFFHEAICSEYNNRCCVTGIAEAGLLQAAHIKPWKDCTADEKTSPSNGLCLNPLHHILFDKGLFTLNDELRIVMSKAFSKQKMDTKTKDWLWSYDNKQIEMPDRYCPDLQFVHFHQTNIFLG